MRGGNERWWERLQRQEWVNQLGRFARLRGPRSRIYVAISALLLLAVTGTLVMVLTNGAAPKSPPHVTTNLRPADTAAPTNTATATTAPTQTTAPATATPRPKPKNPVPQAPPPPPIPPPPAATATPAFCPTPTALPVPPSPTATTAQPTATATTAQPTATTAASPSATGARPGGTIPLAAMSSAACTPCPYYKGNNPDQASIRAALLAAAQRYGLPVNLLYAVAWQESRWHEDVLSCDGGIGLMQLQYYTYPWLNQQSISACGLSATSYDPYTLQDNAYLGAKFLKYLDCYWSYWGGTGGTATSPAAYTIGWYYQQAGHAYPDPTLCGTVFDAHAWYPGLPATKAQPWSCPYDATPSDNTLLDVTLSAYNEGPGNVAKSGIFNWWYVSGVEDKITQFAAGALP